MSTDMVTRQQLEQLQAAQHAVETVETIAATTDTPLLNQLAALGRDLLAQLMTEQNYVPGEIVFREGDGGDATYLIWAGKVAVVKGDFASPTILGFRGAGEVIGEMALLEDLPRSASVVALDDLRLLRVDRDDFQHLLSSNPAIGMSIMATLSARLRVSDDVRAVEAHVGRQLTRRVSELRTETEQLQELERVRQETSDLIVHDLRSPLSIISGVLSMFEMVLPEDVLDENRQLLDIADAACDRIQRLIESLLEVTRMEDRGAVDLHLAETDLRALIQQAADHAALEVQTGRVILRTAIPDDLPPVNIDADKIARVLANLLDNAIKNTPYGRPITVATDVQPDGVIVSVLDVGPGIPPGDRERIFERFAHVAGSRQGSGLGLTYCRLVVEAHGGEIWVEPGPDGVGSRFVFLLPV